MPTNYDTLTLYEVYADDGTLLASYEEIENALDFFDNCLYAGHIRQVVKTILILKSRR